MPGPKKRSHSLEPAAPTLHYSPCSDTKCCSNETPKSVKECQHCGEEIDPESEDGYLAIKRSGEWYCNDDHLVYACDDQGVFKGEKQ